MKKLILFLMSISTVCCTPNKTPEDIGGVEITVPIQMDGNNAKGNEQSMKIKTSSPWSATFSEDWISVTPQSGPAGTSDLKISLKANISKSPRSGSVSIKCAEGTRTLTISQEADKGIFKLEEDEILIESETKLVEIPVYNELTEFQVSFSFLQLDNPEDWMKYVWTKVKEDGKRYLGFQTSSNYTGQPRAVLIYVKSGDLKDTLQATQKFYYEFDAPETETIDFTAVEDHWLKISTTLNYLGDIKVTDGTEWLKFNTYSNSHISISATENTGTIERRGKLQIGYDYAGINHTIEIIQQARKTGRDRDFLIKEIYNRVDDYDRNGLLNWNTNKPLNEWYGVESDGENVTKLSLRFSRSKDLSLDLRPLVDLQEIKIIEDMYANHINVSDMTNLRRISCEGTARYANIKSIDASGCSNLFVDENDPLFSMAVELNLDGVDLNEKLNVTAYWLKSLKLGGPKLKELNINTSLNILEFNNCKNIEKAIIVQAYLDNVYVDDLYFLKELIINNNGNFIKKGTQLEVRHCESLVDFGCAGFVNILVVDCPNAEIKKVLSVDHVKLAGVGDIEISDAKSLEAIQCRYTKRFSVQGTKEMDKVVFEQVSSQICDIFLNFEQPCKEVSIGCPNVGKFEMRGWVMDYPLDLTNVEAVREFDFSNSTNLKKINFENCASESQSFKMFGCSLFEGFDFKIFGRKMELLRMDAYGNWPIVEELNAKQYSPTVSVTIDNVRIKQVYHTDTQNVYIRPWSDGANFYPKYIR